MPPPLNKQQSPLSNFPVLQRKQQGVGRHVFRHQRALSQFRGFSQSKQRFSCSVKQQRVRKKKVMASRCLTFVTSN